MTLLKKTCIPLYTLLLALGNPTVHYFSLDIEGAELKVKIECLPGLKIINQLKFVL